MIFFYFLLIQAPRDAASSKPSVVGRQVSVSGPAVPMRPADVDTHQIQLTMADTAFCDQLLRKAAHTLHGAFEYYRLDALFMVEMRVHRRNGQVVVGMLQCREPLRQLTFMMIVDVR